MYVASQQQRNAVPLEIKPLTSALMIIDMQEYFLHPESPFSHTLAQRMPGLLDYFQERARTVVEPALRCLLDRFRAHGLAVIYTTVASELSDGRDLAPRFQRSNAATRQQVGAAQFPPRTDAWAHIVAALTPRPNELILNKTTFSAFASTGLERTLRHLGMETLVIGGVATNVCVEATARDAVDLGYQVILVEDACATYSPESHEATLLNFQGFGRVRSADEVLALLACAC
jgi:nicotinamidase-related amidase